jgi:HD-GYP domain-containing protein (c-di-GMP phosphodiesterase class II)
MLWAGGSKEDPMMKDVSRDPELDRISRFVAAIIEGRDPDLGGHLQRLGSGSMKFGQQVGCSSEEIRLLVTGAGIHDIGKLSISESILNKPARLTAAEFALVKQHTEFGRKLLTPLELDPRILDIVEHHHENFDGSGYPHGLAGEDIPYLARMVRIWDSCDALTMDRPYHQGVTIDKALRIMQDDSRCYDPYLLKVFGAMIDKTR